MANQCLSELERDAIGEFLNIGMGQAAASLSKIVNEEVSLSVPTVDLLTCQGAVRNLNVSGEQALMAAVREHFSGTCWGGEALLIFPQEQGEVLVRALIGREIPPALLAELEEDALIEVGNVVLNACLSCCSNMLSCEISNSVPIFLIAPLNKLIGDFFSDCVSDQVMFLQVGFTLNSQSVLGYIALIIENIGSEHFLSQIDNYFNISRFSQT